MSAVKTWPRPKRADEPTISHEELLTELKAGRKI
jgi:hypothetical protein